VKAKPSKPSKPAAKKPAVGKSLAKKPVTKQAAAPKSKVVAKPVGKGKPTPPVKAKGKPTNAASKTLSKAAGARKPSSPPVAAKKPTAKQAAPVAKNKASLGAKGRPVVVSKADKTTKAAPAKSLPTKVAPKTKAKTPSKAPQQPSSKALPKVTTPAQGKGKPSKPPVPEKAGAKTQPATLPPTKPAPAAVSAPTPKVVAPPPPPVKLSKASARLAAITVPGLGHVEASTAPKLTFTHADEPVVKPPLIVQVKRDPKLANNWKTKSAEQLTDAELLAMPDAEYMNDKQMAAFRYKLVVLKDSILSNAGETTEHLREETVIVPDPADRATIEEEHALELRTRDRERKLLKKIEQSIARIDAGDYGYCDETGEAIGVGRLLARPTATLSLEAQQRRELKQKMFGD
jgi:DnaK suppressor protein